MNKKSRMTHVIILMLFIVCGSLSLVTSAMATPYGQGVFDANIPFGSMTALSISISGNINLSLTPTGAPTSTSGSHVITVTSNDAVGYNLYAQAVTSSNMISGGNTIPASSNVSAGALATNTWGYNITGSTTNYIGMTTSPALLVNRSGPFTSGDPTTATYGITLNNTVPSGAYSVTVQYTASGA